MDILYYTSWLYGANRRKVRRDVELDDMTFAPASSGVGRLLAALAIVACAVGLLGHASNARLNAASTMGSAHPGEAK